MKGEIEKIKKEFANKLSQIKSLADLAILENEYLSRKSGVLTEMMKDLKSVSKKDIAIIGRLANEVKQNITNEIDALKRKLSRPQKSANTFDLTLPGTWQPLGHLHPVTQAIREIASIFEKIGFQRARYPEVEWDYYAFEALNMPPDHPARDDWETFFIDLKPIDKKYGQRLLTPHTSSGRQIDNSHTPMFHQFEGLVIDEGINITHLKGTVDYFVKSFFGADRTIRLRPHHFKFTEPSFEVDISCGVCLGKGCKMCKEGWLELAGAGMVHPNVLKAGNIDSEKYSGFAFGWGVERCFLMKSGLNIDDIRLLYKNDLRFVNQF